METADLITFDEERHRYLKDGVAIPSVTQILKGVGYIDTTYITEGQDKKGKIVHSMCHYVWKGTLDISTVDKRLEKYLGAFLEFLAVSYVKIEDMEILVYNPMYNYAGRADIKGTINGIPAIIDIKTGAPVWWHGYQSAGYAKALFPTDARRVSRYGLHLSDDGTFKLDPHDRPNDALIFLSAAAVVNDGIRYGRWTLEDIDEDE